MIKTIIIERTTLNKIIRTAIKENRFLLNEVESKSLMKSFNIPVVKTELAQNVTEAKRIAKKMSFPLVMKIVSNDISHKSDVGGVILGINNLKEVESNYNSMLAKIKKINSEANISGISLQPMIEGGVELVAGVTRDKQFGPVLMFGLGGVFIEFMKDVSFKLIPLRKKDAKKMIGEIKSKEILNGARGFPKVNILNLEKILLDLSKFVEANPEIEEVDLNPIIANEKTIIAVDARIVLRK
ncbi:MAG: acetyl-CoA synthetase (ADP-forming) [Chloroflexi bacterium]|jgi:acyl-CoA synthetase (NDP forming)|nr:MAG: acetyl-CoA synthetase (ADP-forming) [Chloroflexota bacterium]|tara:strand:- start:195 stop:917 length:723 start_codon:yes stop_codon:yes gene_type:complete